MKKRIIVITLIMAALTACAKEGKEYDPASVEADINTKEKNDDNNVLIVM